MGYFKTIHEKNSAKITGLITVILLLLLFVVGMQYLDPPEEYGVAVNFGTTDFGSGNKPLSQPVKSEVKEVTEKTEPQEEVQPEKSSSASEEVITQETEESIAIKKQQEAEAKAKAEEERIEREKKEAEERKQREEQEKKDKINDLIGGVKNSNSNSSDGEGPDNQSGNKGELDGNPYAPYNGIPGAGEGGIGVGLNGRGKATFKRQEGCENEYGIIIVQIVVNREGRVIEATPGVRGSNNITACLKEVAKRIAMSYKWPPDSKAPLRQYGKVLVNFSPN